MPDHTLILSPEALQGLSALQSEPKFHPEHLYPGARTEEVRRNAEAAINALLGRLRVGLPASPRKSYVLSECLDMLKAFEGKDTEEREQACTYCERVMELLGIESSDGLLDTWLYGFDPEQKP